MDKNQKNKLIYWLPRALSVFFVIFLAMFSLDVFEEGLGFWQRLLAFLMHNIPTFVMLSVLIVAWKREIVGAIAFLLLGLLYAGLVLISRGFQWFMLVWIFQISGLAFLIAYLFFLGWKKKRNKRLK